MPKKSARNVRETRIGKRIHEVPKTTSAEVIVKQFRSIHINVKTAKRWFFVKKRLEFVTDDEVAAYLLDLAEPIIRRDRKCASLGDWKTDPDKENDLEVIKVDEKEPLNGEEPLRRSPRKQLPAASEVAETSAEIAKEEQRIEPEIVEKESLEPHEKRRSRVKHHKTKGKHHKEKRNKRKHSKNSEEKNVGESNDERPVLSRMDDKKEDSEAILKQHNIFHPSIPKLVVERLSVVEKNLKSEKLEISHKNEKPCSPELVENSKNTSNAPNNVSEEDPNKDDELLGVSKETVNLESNYNLESLTADTNGYNIPENVEKVIENNFNEKSSDIIEDKKLETEIQTVEPQMKTIIEEKKTKKKRKHPKQDLPEVNEISLENPADESVHKRHRKKHKYPTLHKKRRYHDGRKAPQDGRAAGLEDLESPELDIILPESLPVINAVQPEVEGTGIIAEPQRLAIKIKLCSDCNDRHVEDACPLNSTEYVIPDSVSHKDWLNAHRNNADVMKAVASDDPMSEGYAVFTEDAEESDEESAPGEQYKSKTKVEGEEKQLHVSEDRPLYSRESLPNCFELKTTTPEHGVGIYARHGLPMYAKLGPLVGSPVKEMDIPDDFSMRHIWEIDDNGKTSYISTTNPLKSNWIRYMRPADTKDDRTVAVVTNHGELHLVTTQNITTGMELTYWADSQSSAWTRKNKTDKTNCGGCNLNFTHPIYYRLHCCIFHDTNYSLTIRKYHCKICGDAVLGKDNIMKHAADLHGGRGAYQCQYCRKFFLRLNYLEMHRTYGCSQNPQRSRPLCDFCGRKFCQPQKLKVHIKRMHSDMSEVLREFQCKLCLKLLGSRAALQRHMKEVHHKDVVAAATCDRCGKMFQNKSNLKIHMLTHSGVKPFKCKEKDCKAAFTTKQCLQFHYKKVHGLTEDMMPKIERSVAYTFDAYSGGLVEDINRGQTTRSGRRGSQQDNSNSVMSLDECSSEHSSRADASVSSFQATINDFENDVVSTTRENLDHVAQDREIQQRDHEIQDHEMQNRNIQDHEMQNRDLQDHEMQNPDLQDHDMQNRDLHDHAMQSRDLHDHEIQNRDLHDHDMLNRDLHGHDIQNRNLQDDELQNRNLQAHELRNRNLQGHELQDRELQDHELQNRDLQDHELQSRNLHDHEMQNRDLRDREMQNRDLRDREMQERDMRDHEMQNCDMRDHEMQNRDLRDHEIENREMQDRHIKESPPPSTHHEIQIVSSAVSPLEPLRPSPEVDFYGMSRLQSKGSKKWMGEFNPPVEAEIVQEHSVASSRDVYEFDENPKKDDIRNDPVSASLLNGSKLGLNIYRRPESTNASLLVEAALDAAERDIGAVSSPMLDDSDRDGNLYSIPSQLQSPLPSRSSEAHLESYIQQQDDLMSPSATPDGRKTPSSHVQIDYHLHRPVEYINSPRTHNIEQYLPQDELPRVSSPSGYIHIPQEDLTSPSATPNSTRYQGIHHHHHHHHQVPTDNLSSDEGDSVAQNLSLSVKEKALQLDLSTSYKYDALDAEFCRERTNFEPLVINSGELQGLDMSARSFHHSIGSQLPNSRYHHHLYEITERQSVDLSRTSGYSTSPPPPPYPHSEVLRIVSLDLTPSHSVDLSLSRSHHFHTAASRVIGNERVQLVSGNSQTPGSSNSHVVPDTLEGRILSPPPPSIPGYNATYPVSPAAYHPPRPGYHHYSGYY